MHLEVGPALRVVLGPIQYARNAHGAVQLRDLLRDLPRGVCLQQNSTLDCRLRQFRFQKESTAMTVAAAKEATYRSGRRASLHGVRERVEAVRDDLVAEVRVRFGRVVVADGDDLRDQTRHVVHFLLQRDLVRQVVVLADLCRA